MKTRFAFATVLAILVTMTALSAQAPGKVIKYTGRMELVKATGPGAGATTDMGEMMANMLKQMMFANGPVDLDYATDGESVRTELHAQMATMPKGSIILYQAGKLDGVVLNPIDKTYYVLRAAAPPAEAAAMLAQMKPEVTVAPSGTFETILGHKAEKVDVTMRMALPIPAGAEVPPNMPSEFVINLENWCATDLKMPAAAMKLAGMVAQGVPGFNLADVAKACPFSLRMRMRMSMMPGWEMVSSVVSIDEAAATPDLFKIPEGFKEVPPPRIGGLRE